MGGGVQQVMKKCVKKIIILYLFLLKFLFYFFHLKRLQKLF